MDLEVGQSYSFHLFFAERRTNASNFRIDTSIELVAQDPYQYQVLARDADGDQLTYSLIDPPEGMTINNTGLIEWTPREQDIGDHLIGVQVSDGENGTIQNYSLTIE